MNEQKRFSPAEIEKILNHLPGELSVTPAGNVVTCHEEECDVIGRIDDENVCALVGASLDMAKQLHALQKAVDEFASTLEELRRIPLHTELHNMQSEIEKHAATSEVLMKLRTPK